jgi:phenylalanyl-tRNA synthetase beta chain
VDFFDVKGLLELVTGALGLPAVELAEEGLPAWLHPGRAASLRWEGAAVGWLGAVHPEQAQAWDLKDETFVGELTLEPLLAASVPPVRFRALPRAPAVARDLSLLCDVSVRAGDLERWVREAAGGRLLSVEVADRYDGPPVPADKVSLTLSLLFQDPSRTLTGEEVQASVNAVVARLRAQGIEIRGE